MRYKLPARFYVDRMERSCAVPVDHGTAARTVTVDSGDPEFRALVSDAEYYARPYGPDNAPHIVRAAKSLLACLVRQGYILPR